MGRTNIAREPQVTNPCSIHIKSAKYKTYFHGIKRIFSTSLTTRFLNSDDNENTLNRSISLSVGFSKLLYVDIESLVQ